MVKLALSEIGLNELCLLVDRVEKELMHSANVYYFNIDPNSPHENQIGGFNSEQLARIAKSSGVYAIWVKTASTTSIRYIGQTKGSIARARLTNHFFKKDPRTGSQLSKVILAVADGYDVGFTFVAVDPPLIRLYIEAVLIARHQDLCAWNKHSKESKPDVLKLSGKLK